MNSSIDWTNLFLFSFKSVTLINSVLVRDGVEYYLW